VTVFISGHFEQFCTPSPQESTIKWGDDIEEGHCHTKTLQKSRKSGYVMSDQSSEMIFQQVAINLKPTEGNL
jgi:hypothetical protein